MNDLRMFGNKNFILALLGYFFLFLMRLATTTIQ